MNEKTPVLDVVIGPAGDAWRMHFAPASWWSGMLQRRMNERREIFPVARPDAEDLENFMFQTDSPYEHRRTADGALEIRAQGRSAVTLVAWLEELVRSAPTLPSGRFRV